MQDAHRDLYFAGCTNEDGKVILLRDTIRDSLNKFRICNDTIRAKGYHAYRIKMTMMRKPKLYTRDNMTKHVASARAKDG
jgi:hypothetical protein